MSESDVKGQHHCKSEESVVIQDPPANGQESVFPAQKVTR